MPSHPFRLRSISILSSHLCLGLPNGLFHGRFPTKTQYTFLHICRLSPASQQQDVPHWGNISPVGQGLLIIEASRSHPDTPQSVGLLCTNDQPDLTTHNSHKRQTSVYSVKFRTRDPSKRRAANPSLKARNQWGLAYCDKRDQFTVQMTD